MNQGAKVLLGVLALGGIGALVFASEKKANASPGGAPPILPPLTPPLPGTPIIPPSGGVVVVPPIPDPSVPAGSAGPSPSSPPPLVVPLPPGPLPSIPTLPAIPGLPTGVVPGGSPSGNTISLPGLGTFNPATGNVFGPNGVIIGTFDPTTGKFTPSVPVPGLPGGVQVTPPAPPIPTQVLPGLTITPGPSPTPLEPPASPAEQGSAVAADTLAVLTAMLAQEHSPHWRIIPEPSLKPWQAARGLTPDGNYGTGTALKLAAETGMVPIIRGWPKGTVRESPNLKNYQNALRALAATASEPRRSQLLAAAQREQGQGYGTPEKPIVTLITLQDA